MKNYVWLCAILSFLAASNTASACSCKPRNLSKSIERADVILVAEISHVTNENVTFVPIEVFKGTIKQPLIFPNASSTIGCDYFGLHNARVGERHLVFYASFPTKKPYLSFCTPSGPVEKSVEELKVLRKQFRKDAEVGSQ